ncbi:MAG: polysaccharide biosynthesis/export family protein [Planctomycetota bacterium]|nr:polysaccharide biosynthesis/export family protein [Planctomycetota bacterium]
MAEISSISANSRRGLLLVALLAAITQAAGCATTTYQQSVVNPALSGPADAVPVGRELNMVSLPSYRIEPPDVLQIEAVRVIPKSPFRIKQLDALQIDVQGTSLDAPPIQNQLFFVDPDGFVNLGPSYGKIKVSGMTLEQAREAVDKQFRRTLAEPQVSLTLADAGGQQQITGANAVGPDGYINLGTYGSVYVTGMTVEEATAAVEEQLAKYLEQPRISLSVVQYQSKFYYVVTEGAGFGDQIARFPVTGNETVMDAVTQVNGISRLSSKDIWIARPAPGEEACFQQLPVEWESIVKRGESKTNYQVLPGDRIFIREDHLVATDSYIARLTAPFERILGFALLGTNTVQTVNRFPQGFLQQSGP